VKEKKSIRKSMLEQSTIGQVGVLFGALKAGFKFHVTK
jgi:hypothetical protein